MEQLAKHGIMKPPKMQGLAPEQVEELKLKDDTDKYYPSGGDQQCVDEIGRRTGKAPGDAMRDVISRTISEAKASISKVWPSSPTKPQQGKKREEEARGGKRRQEEGKGG